MAWTRQTLVHESSLGETQPPLHMKGGWGVEGEGKMMPETVKAHCDIPCWALALVQTPSPPVSRRAPAAAG